MQAEFYDVKKREKVKLEVAFKKQTRGGRGMIYGKTDDGRNLPCFIKKDEYDTVYKSVPEEGAEPKKAAAKKTCAKKGCCKKK